MKILHTNTGLKWESNDLRKGHGVYFAYVQGGRYKVFWDWDDQAWSVRFEGGTRVGKGHGMTDFRQDTPIGEGYKTQRRARKAAWQHYGLRALADVGKEAKENPGQGWQHLRTLSMNRAGRDLMLVVSSGEGTREWAAQAYRLRGDCDIKEFERWVKTREEGVALLERTYAVELLAGLGDWSALDNPRPMYNVKRWTEKFKRSFLPWKQTAAPSGATHRWHAEIPGVGVYYADRGRRYVPDYSGGGRPAELPPAWDVYWVSTDMTFPYTVSTSDEPGRAIREAEEDAEWRLPPMVLLGLQAKGNPKPKPLLPWTRESDQHGRPTWIAELGEDYYYLVREMGPGWLAAFKPPGGRPARIPASNAWFSTKLKAQLAAEVHYGPLRLLGREGGA